MKLPPLIKIKDSTYHLIVSPHMDKDILGLCDSQDKIIYISSDQDALEFKQTVMHECLHAISDEFNLKLNHKIINKLEIGLAQIFDQLLEHNQAAIPQRLHRN